MDKQRRERLKDQLLRGERYEVTRDEARELLEDIEQLERLANAFLAQEDAQ